MPDIALPYEEAGILPRVAWDNFLSGPLLSSVTASSEDADEGPALAAAGWSLAHRWRTTAGAGTHTYEVQLTGAGVAASAWGIAGHDLHDAGATVHLERYDGGGWVQVGDAYMPADASVIYGPFDAVADDRWRIVISGASQDIEIGLIFIGPDLVLQRGCQPGWADPRLAQKAELVQQVSRDRTWLGASVLARFAQLSLSLKNIDDTWARDYILPWRRACEAQPCLLHWNTQDWPTSAAYCSQLEFDDVPFASKGYVDLSVSMRVETEP